MIYNSKCKLCPLHGFPDTKVCMKGQGSHKNKVMIVSDFPDEGENNTGYIYGGNNSHFLENQLNKNGYGLKDFYLTYTVKCYSYAKPSASSVKKCSQYLCKEIRLFKPKIVLTLGLAAVKSFKKVTSLKKIVGKPFECTMAGHTFTVFPCYNHNACLYNLDQANTFKEDIDLFCQYLKGEVKETKTHITKSNLFKEKFIAMDIETTGLDPRVPGAKLLSVAIGTDKWQTIYKPKDIFSLKADLGIFTQSGGRVITHNGKFDYGWILAQHHFMLVENPTDDTYVLAGILNIEKKSLLDLSIRILKVKDYYLPEDLSKLSDDLIDKQAKDIIYTYRIYHELIKRVKKTNQLWTYEKVNMPALKSYILIENTGMMVDKKKEEFLREIWEDTRDKCLESLKKYEDISWTSPKQIRELLYEKIKARKIKGDFKFTPTGELSTSDLALRKMIDCKTGERPRIIDELLEYRGLNTDLKIVFDKIVQFKHNGWIHPTFNVEGARTGRTSCSNPNVQQITNKESRAHIRSIFRAPRGWKFWAADYGQLQLRLIAEASQDKNMIEVFKQGKDFNTNTAKMITGLEEDEITKDIRKKAKILNFGISFGMTSYGLVNSLIKLYGIFISEEEAQTYIDKYYDSYRGFYRYKKDLENFIWENLYAESKTGRRMYFTRESLQNDPHGHLIRSGINATIQAFEFDVITLAVNEITQKLVDEHPDKIRLCATIHDEICGYVRNDSVDFLKKVYKIMLSPQKLVKRVKMETPLTVTIKCGPNWYNSKSMEV